MAKIDDFALFYFSAVGKIVRSGESKISAIKRMYCFSKCYFLLVQRLHILATEMHQNSL